MDQSSRKHKNLPLGDGLHDELVRRGDETDIQLAFQDEHHLCGAGMGVRWVEAPRGVVNARHGDAESVETWDFLYVGSCHNRAHGVVCGPWGGQAQEGEVCLSYRRRRLAGEAVHLDRGVVVGNAEVLEHVGVGGEGGGEEEEEDRGEEEQERSPVHFDFGRRL